MTAEQIASFGDGLLGPSLRVRAATSAWRLKRSLLSADVMGIDSVVMDEIVGWLLGWIWGPLSSCCGMAEGLWRPVACVDGLVCPWGVAWFVGILVENLSLVLEFD